MSCLLCATIIKKWKCTFIPVFYFPISRIYPLTILLTGKQVGTSYTHNHCHRGKQNVFCVQCCQFIFAPWSVKWKLRLVSTLSLPSLSFHQICVVLRQHPVMPSSASSVTRYFIIKMRSRPGPQRGQEGSVPLTCKNIIWEPSISHCISEAGDYQPFHQCVMTIVTFLRFRKSLQ